MFIVKSFEDLREKAGRVDDEKISEEFVILPACFNCNDTDIWIPCVMDLGNPSDGFLSLNRERDPISVTRMYKETKSLLFQGNRHEMPYYTLTLWNNILDQKIGSVRFGKRFLRGSGEEVAIEFSLYGMATIGFTKLKNDDEFEMIER